MFTIISLQPSLVTRSPTNTRPVHHTTRISYDISCVIIRSSPIIQRITAKSIRLMMKTMKIFEKKIKLACRLIRNLICVSIVYRDLSLHSHRTELNRGLGGKELARSLSAIIGHQGQLQRVLPSVFIEIVPRINVPRRDDKRGKRKEKKKSKK